MEIFEQLRFFFIILMAFLSYRHVNTNLSLPPSLSSEDEESMLGEPEESEQANFETKTAQNQEAKQLGSPQETAQNVSDIQPVKLPDDQDESCQEKIIAEQLDKEQELSYSQVLGEIQDFQEEDPNVKVLKSKKIKKDWKKAAKKLPETSTIKDNEQAKILIQG